MSDQTPYNIGDFVIYSKEWFEIIDIYPGDEEELYCELMDKKGTSVPDVKLDNVERYMP